ncbi:MAG: DUF3332 domain-containing protein [Paramuribaculum sp.]|nr:DUF3332 domain-containing protein [Paramuribaculum sp.]
MKSKLAKPLVALTVASSLTFTSCIGSFDLTNRLLSWNNQVGNKFVNEVVFIAFWILPVYEVSALADLLVLNTIEFWSGNKALAQGKSIIEGNDGKYLVDCDGKGYTVTSLNDHSSVRFDFDSNDRSWSYSVEGSESVKFMTFIDDTHVKVPGVDGLPVTVELTEQGLTAYRTSAAPALQLSASR